MNSAGRKKVPRKLAAAVAAIIVVGAAGCASGGETESKPAKPDAKASKANTDPKSAKSKPANSKPVEPTATASQENALRAAESYLSYEAFSKSGLEKQLKFESYRAADAKYGAAHVGADWNEQAVKTAESYLEYESFSESGLVQQLEFEGYTPSQAEYGVSKAYR